MWKVVCQISLFLSLACVSACQGQSNPIKMAKEKSTTNPLLCDPETGFCELPLDEKTASAPSQEQSSTKKIRLIYFTDPICSSCWGIEPQLKKLKLEYGTHIEIEYRMGGLLPDWSYNSGGISKPSDVAHHWDEVGHHYEMPIDGDLWLEDPLDSSYPPSIAFKAAQLQDKKKALLFLREMREMVFLQKKNIAKWEHMAHAAQEAGLDVAQLRTDFEGKGKDLFEADLKLAKEMGVRGFPSIFFKGQNGQEAFVYGRRPYVNYEKAIHELYPNLVKATYAKDWESLFQNYPSLTRKEFSVLSGNDMAESQSILNQLNEKGRLQILRTKNGHLWKEISTRNP